MKINLKTVLLLVGVPLILSSPCALAHTDVTAEQARELIDSTDDLIVVDVREPSEYCDTKGHIPGALNYPWYSGVLEAQYGELPMDGPVLVVCGSGSRSNRAADFLDSKDFSMVYDMLGGMSANWIWETEPCVDPDSKYGGGTGEPDDPYQIATAEDLMLLGESPEDYDNHFILTADINLDPNLPGRKIFDKAVIAPDTNDTKDSFEGVSFTGAFDGKNHVISNLHIQGGDYLGYLGLFGQLDSGAMVSNLGLEAVNVNGTGDYLGGLVGQNDGSIATSYCTGTVSGHMYFGDYVGGLVGLNYGSIAMSYSTGKVTGRWNVGGLAGSNSGNITKSYTMGTVSGDFQIGGLVGANGVGTVT
ncbi:MAG TPA: rhodanese-like domain-containing protein, partial [Sedimentisphaerales bacterium]|nr:rhodanese-like domain-containing protein [Sedimentisphaerales bacterium]